MVLLYNSPVSLCIHSIINAVSDFATHREPYRRTANYKENMFMKTVDGNALIDTAYKMVKEMVA